MEQHPENGSVVVVGAGVSGCACAAALADAGLRVTLVNSANDRVGLPTYGPNIVESTGPFSRLEAVFDRLPKAVRSVWLGSMLRPASGSPVMNVDRRRVSIELKRVLEGLEGLEFRQGFVVDLRVTGGADDDSAATTSSEPEGVGGGAGARAPRAQVETIFGEVLQANAIVLAVGLSLHSETAIGEGVTPGGRYGEPASDGLYGSLEALGSRFREVRVAVGGSLPGSDGRRLAEETVSESGSGSSVSDEELVAASAASPLAPWPKDYPAAPHWNPELRGARMLVQKQGCGQGGLEAAKVSTPLLSPDGAVADEVYVTPSAPAQEHAGDCAIVLDASAYARMPLIVTARVVSSVTSGGRLVAGPASPPVWVCGRASGATGYAESLESGVSVAAEVAKWLRSLQ